MEFEWKSEAQTEIKGETWDVTTYHRDGSTIILEQYFTPIPDRECYNPYEIHMGDYSNITNSAGSLAGF